MYYFPETIVYDSDGTKYVISPRDAEGIRIGSEDDYQTVNCGAIKGGTYTYKYENFNGSITNMKSEYVVPYKYNVGGGKKLPYVCVDIYSNDEVLKENMKIYFIRVTGCTGSE